MNDGAILDQLSNFFFFRNQAEELKSRNVKITNFYDVAFDYILIDSFEDLETPPSSVVAVMKNRWLSNGFKEGALQVSFKI